MCIRVYVGAHVYVYVNDQLNMNKYKTKLHLRIQRWLCIFDGDIYAEKIPTTFNKKNTLLLYSHP